MRSILLALLSLAASPIVATAEPLQANQAIVSLRQRDCVLTCTAPEIVRKGDDVAITIELTNDSSAAHIVANFFPGQQPDGRFRVWAEWEGKRFYHPRRAEVGMLEPRGTLLKAGETLRSVVDITPITVQMPDSKHFQLWISVTLDGDVILPGPNRLASSCIVGMVLRIMAPEEYDAIVEAEQRGRELQAAATGPTTHPAK